MSKPFVVKGSVSDYARNTVIDEKGVLAFIKDWDFAKDDEETIVLKLIFKTGTKKGSTKDDFVTFATDAKMNWKYASLRDAIGEPIQAEDAFDLQSLVGRYLLVDLVPSKNGNYQNINYRKYNETLLENLVATSKNEEASAAASQGQQDPAKKDSKTPTATADLIDDDLPF